MAVTASPGGLDRGDELSLRRELAEARRAQAEAEAKVAELEERLAAAEMANAALLGPLDETDAAEPPPVLIDAVQNWGHGPFKAVHVTEHTALLLWRDELADPPGRLWEHLVAWRQRWLRRRAAD